MICINTLNKTFFIIIFCLVTLPAFAQNKSKTISIKSKSISIKEVFQQIEQQTEYSIAYEHSGIDLEHEVSLSLKDANINKAMREVLTDLKLAYKINGYHVVIYSTQPIEEGNQYKPEDGQRSKPDDNGKTILICFGNVVDSITLEPLAYATISLFDSQSGLIVSGITNDSGSFSINTDKAPSSVRISFIGYKTFVYHPRNENLNLGQILLSPDENVLQATTITASTVNHKIDRNSYLVTDEMREHASNAQELLDQIHGVRYDKLLNSIKVGIESAVLLLVDDVQQSETYIKNLPVNRISRIEVITEPTGRHLSEGYAAIINFILKKDYSGHDVNVRNFSMVSLAGYNGSDWLINDQPGVGVTYTKDKINVFANYTYARIKMNTPVWKNQTYNGLYEMQSEITGKDNPNNRYDYLANYIGGGVNYQLNPKHALSYQMDYSFQKIKDETDFNYRVTNIKVNTQSTTTSLNQNKTRDKDYVGTMFYKGEFGENIKLYSDFTYNYYSNDIQNVFNQSNIYHQQNLYTERKDYTKFNVESEYTINPKFTLSAGYVNVWRKYGSKSVEGITLLDYTERRNQLFAYLQYKVNEKLTMKAGASGEYIYISSDGKNSFWNIHPYFQLNYKINDNVNLNLSYLTNSYYPTLYQLSPMTTAIDSLMMQSGNPNLKSAVRHTVSAKMTFWDRLTVRSMFKYTPKRISEIYTYEKGNYYSTFANIDVKQYVIQAIYDQPLGKYFNMSNTLTYYYDKAGYKGIKNSYSGWMLDSEIGYFNPRYNFGAQLGYYRSIDKSALLQGYQMLNLDSWMISTQKQFWKKRASLMISYFPPFDLGVRDKLDKEINTPFYNEKQTQSLKPYRNMLMVRFSLRFNSGKTRSSSKQSSTEREERARRAVDF